MADESENPSEITSNDDKKYIVLSLITTDKTSTGCFIIGENEPYLMIYRPVYGPSSYMDCFDWIGYNCKPIHRWWEDEEKTAKARESARTLFAPFSTRRVEIGHLDGIPEFKTEWEGDFIKYPVLYTRKSKLTVYAEFAAPSIDDIWGDITSCAVAAGAAAGIAAILASPAAALPAFKAAFMACIYAKIGDRANEISVSLSTEQTSGDWSRV